MPVRESVAVRRRPRPEPVSQCHVRPLRKSAESRGTRASCGGSPREGARSELASVAATGGGGLQAPPTRIRWQATVRYPRAIAQPLVLRRGVAVPSWPAAVYPAAVLLALVLPFEAIQPVLVTPWVSLTDEKVVLLIAVVAWV